MFEVDQTSRNEKRFIAIMYLLNSHPYEGESAGTKHEKAGC